MTDTLQERLRKAIEQSSAQRLPSFVLLPLKDAREAAAALVGLEAMLCDAQAEVERLRKQVACRHQWPREWKEVRGRNVRYERACTICGLMDYDD